jgi:hypothetical protein
MIRWQSFRKHEGRQDLISPAFIFNFAVVNRNLVSGFFARFLALTQLRRYAGQSGSE